MGSDFLTYSFADLLSNIVDNRGKTCPVSEAGLPLIATNCVKNDTLFPIFEKVRFVNMTTYENWFRGHPEPGDMVFVTKGSPGNVCWVPEPVNFCIAQDMVAIRANKKIVDPKYLFALLRSPSTQARIHNMHVGTLIPHFKKGDFKNLYFDIPSDMGMQRAIGEIYFRFCEKIDLNRRMNETLEAMAKVLFKSWFVDFDPVIDNAQAAGNSIPEEHQARFAVRKLLGDTRKPLPEAVKALFPNEFEYAEEMGWIPKGWRVGCLDDMVILQRGFDLPKKQRTDGAYPLIAASGQDGTHNESKVTGPGVVTGRSGKLGIVTFVQEDFWPLNTTLWVKEYKNSTPYHAYLLLDTLGFERFNAGSAVPTLNRNHVHGMKLVVPPQNIIEKFSDIAESFFNKCSVNSKATEELASIRDALLPRLLSGEIHLSKDEDLVEAEV